MAACYFSTQYNTNNFSNSCSHIKGGSRGRGGHGFLDGNVSCSKKVLSNFSHEKDNYIPPKSSSGSTPESYALVGGGPIREVVLKICISRVGNSRGGIRGFVCYTLCI